MNYKRKLYILLGIASLLLPVVICKIFCTPEHFKLLSIITSGMLYLLYIFIPVIINAINGNDDGYYDILPFTNMFFSINRKKIYYSDLGYFYLSVNKNSDIIIYEQKIFYTKKLFMFDYIEDFDKNRQIIKNKLDRIYSSEIERRKVKSVISKWDGYIDTISKRDDKINKILK